MTTTTNEQVDTLDVTASLRAGRVLVTQHPARHVYLASSRVVHIALKSSTPSTEIPGMDGVPTITVAQFQRVTMTAWVETVSHAAITQATVQGVMSSVFRPSKTGAAPVLEFTTQVSDAIFDTKQTDAIDRDGYNFKVEYELNLPGASVGGSTYVLESVIELTSGELVTLTGRVRVTPVLSEPINLW